MQLPSAETSLRAKNKIKKGKKRGAGAGARWVLGCALSPFPAQGVAFRQSSVLGPATGCRGAEAGQAANPKHGVFSAG